MKKIIIILPVILVISGLILLLFYIFKSKPNPQPNPNKSVQTNKNRLPDVIEGAPLSGSPDDLKTKTVLNDRLNKYPWTKNMPYFSHNYIIDFDENYRILIKINFQSEAQKIQYLSEAQNWLKGQGAPEESINQAQVKYIQSTLKTR